MSKTYLSRRQEQRSTKEQPASRSRAAGPSLQELAAGAMPSQEQMGHQVDLPEAIRTKMETSFGADFSGVQLYESQTVADADARAITMGNKISFAPGQLDLNSSGGQAVLGHELSHVASQARGEVGGRGFLADHALEARADREGARAAAGENVYSGSVAPLSDSAVTSATAGVMQASKDDKEKDAPAPAQAPVSEELQNRAQSYVDDYNADKKAHSDAAEEALEKYNAGREVAYEPLQGAGWDLYRGRYLHRHLKGRTEEDQMNMIEAFQTNDMEKMRPYFQEEIDRISGMDPEAMQAMFSDSEEEVAAAGSQYAKVSSDLHSVSDMLRFGFLTGETMGYDIENDVDAMEKMARFRRNVSTINSGSFFGVRAMKRLARGERETEDEKEMRRAKRPEMPLKPQKLGEKTSEQTLGYRSEAAGERAKANDLDPTNAEDNDALMRRMYDKIKNPDPDDTPEEISRRKQLFAQLRAQQMDAEWRRQQHK